MKNTEFLPKIIKRIENAKEIKYISNKKYWLIDTHLRIQKLFNEQLRYNDGYLEEGRGWVRHPILIGYTVYFKGEHVDEFSPESSMIEAAINKRESELNAARRKQVLEEL